MLGLRRVSVVLLTAALALNVALNYLVLYGPMAGSIGPVAGVALTTVLVHTAVAGASIVAVAWVLRRRGESHLRPTVATKIWTL